MSAPKRALISITSATAPLHQGHSTGVFIEEALHPFNVFKAAGFEVDIASEKGTWGPDWLSLQSGFLPDEDKKQYEDTDGEFRKKLDSGTTPDKLNADDVRLHPYKVMLVCSGVSRTSGNYCHSYEERQIQSHKSN